MGLFDKIKEPIFLKDTSDTLVQLEKLKSLQTDNTEISGLIEQDIKLLQYGIAGENNIAFELKNSHIPMFILHDIRLEYRGLTAQIDYILITRGKVFVVECKNLYGNIDIDNQGNFTRTIQYGNRYKKEGIYSPITQNQRHLDLIKKIISDRQTNPVRKAMFEKYFYQDYKSVVVLANPSTVLNAKYAKKEIKKQIIRADQLISYIKSENSGETVVSENRMQDMANFFLSLHKENPVDYTQKYIDLINAKKQTRQNKPSEPVKEELICPKCGGKMIKRKATKGAYAGKEFWGCSNYPKCKFIINIK